MKLATHADHGNPSDPHAGHKMTDDQGSRDRHAGHSVAMFRDKFWLSFALTIPVVIWSSDVQRWFGYTAPSFPGSKLIPAGLGTLVFVYGGLVFLRGAQRELADHKPGMMTLISLAIIVAFGTSVAAAFGLFEIDVWWEGPAGNVAGLTYTPTVHLNCGEKVMTVRDGLPKFKDFPKEFGGSGTMLPE